MKPIYTLSEHSFRTGAAHLVSSAACIGSLLWSEIDALSTHSVQRGSVTLAEFEGHEALAAKVWLTDHADYDGRDGVKAWKGLCAWCDKALVDGSCNCPDGRGCSYAAV